MKAGPVCAYSNERYLWPSPLSNGSLGKIDPMMLLQVVDHEDFRGVCLEYSQSLRLSTTTTKRPIYPHRQAAHDAHCRLAILNGTLQLQQAGTHQAQGCETAAAGSGR